MSSIGWPSIPPTLFQAAASASYWFLVDCGPGLYSEPELGPMAAKMTGDLDAPGLAVLAADNFAVEAVPPRESPDGRAYERVHELCLFKLGIHLGELWHLGELNAWLRANQRTRFLLTAPPLRLTGAVGSPATPIATV